MYIGPWQEYNLSKASEGQGNGRYSGRRENKVYRDNQAAQASNALNPEDILKALTATLDPESAKQAIAALVPLIQKSDGSHSTILPPVHSIHQTTQKGSDSPASFRSSVSEPMRLQPKQFVPMQPLSGRREEKNTMRKAVNKMKLPELKKKDKFSSDSVMDDSTVYSMPSTPDMIPRPQPLLLPADAAHSDYNANEVLAILKLDNQKKPKFAQFWKWNESDGNGIATLPKKESNTEKKLKTLQNMRAIYSTKGNQIPQHFAEIEGNKKNLLDSRQVDSNKIPTSPIRVRNHYGEVPKTPIVEEKSLTETDIAIVSKYFVNSGANFQQINQNSMLDRSIPSEHVGGHLPNRQILSFAGSTSLQSEIDKHSHSRLDMLKGAEKSSPLRKTAGYYDNSNQNFENSFSPKYPPSKPYHVSSPRRSNLLAMDRVHSTGVDSTGDEMNSLNGFESLLNWSQNLNVDEF